MPVRSPANALCMRRSESPLKLVLALRPMRQSRWTKAASELISFPRFVSVPPPAPLVMETYADHGPISIPPSTPSSNELKVVAVTVRMKAVSSSMRSPNGTNMRPILTYHSRFFVDSIA